MAELLIQDPGRARGRQPAPQWTNDEAFIRIQQRLLDGIQLISDGSIPQLTPHDQIKHIVLVFSDGLALLANGFEEHTREVRAYLNIARNYFRPRPQHFELARVPLSAISEVRTLFQNKQGLEDSGVKSEITNLLADAVRLGASDIHFRVTDNETILKFRMLGDLIEQRQMTAVHGIQMLTALYNANESGSHPSYVDREYQEASIPGQSEKISIPPEIAALRLQYDPLAYGKRLGVLRIHRRVDPQKLSLETQGYNAKQIELVKLMIRAPQGLLVTSGPTGSGKTTTLMTLILMMSKLHPERLTITVEDPAEIPMSSAAQLALEGSETIEEKRSAYLKAMSATLRSDPDNIFFGEMRDGPSAQIGYQASETGHLTLTTTHANDAIGIISRTRQLGVDDFYVFDPTLTIGLIAQRLVKTLCPDCKKPANEESLGAEWERFERFIKGRDAYMRGPGCDTCRNVLPGYSGRSAVAEIIMPDEPFMNLYLNKGKFEARRYWIEQMGGETLFDHAVAKVWDGAVDIRDVEKGIGLLNPDRFGLEMRETCYG